MQCKKAQTADAPRQGERPRICCHQRRDTTARLEGPTLAENQYRKKNLNLKKDVSMRKIKFISILLVLSMLLTVPVFAFSTGFTDVSEKATYAESVSYLADAGILRGTASGRFSPNERITVSQWATMLCRAFDTEPEGVSWQEAGTNAVQTAVRGGWLEPTAISDTNGSICRGELYRTAFAAAGIPLYDATLYGLDWLSDSENALRVGKTFGLCAENKTAAGLVTRAEAAQLLHAVLTQNLTVTPPDTPVTVENLIQWNVNAFLLELRKVPQPILDAFNENGWTFVIGTECLADLSRKLGVNCIGAAAYTEKRIYVFEASAILHEFGHFLDCTMGFPQEHKDLYALEAASAPMKQHAKSNSLEYFAEFFAYWLSGSTRTLAQLKELTPETYAYFDELASVWLPAA